MSKILFLGGPSGCGKSHFASHDLVSRGWRHLEIDQFPADGITEQGLRGPWDSFYEGCEPHPLHNLLVERAAGSEGIVLSFPSTLVFSAEHLGAARGMFQIGYLFGREGYCLTSFLERERRSGRGLDTAHWRGNNANVYFELARPENLPLLVNAFHEDGTRRDADAIFADLFPK